MNALLDTPAGSLVMIEAEGDLPTPPLAGGPDLEDAALLARLRGRDLGALEALMARYERPLRQAATAFLRQADDAEDAVQDTFIAAWDGAGRTGPATRLRPWLFAILFNQCRKSQRAWIRLRRRETAAAAGRAEVAPEEDHEREERLAAIAEAFPRLSEDHREALILRFQQGLGVAETAASLGVSPGTVKSRVSRALAALKGLVGLEVQP